MSNSDAFQRNVFSQWLLIKPTLSYNYKPKSLNVRVCKNCMHLLFNLLNLPLEKKLSKMKRNLSFVFETMRK